jgi:uncharacterized protein YrrD
MLFLSSVILNQEVLSLRTASAVASIIKPIINPNNLKIEGFYCRDYSTKQVLILLEQDIREFQGNGYIVNDHDSLSNAEDLIRLKNIMTINFELINKKVETISGNKVGKVEDYAVDNQSFFIQKIYSSKPIYKKLNNNRLMIDRSQINEITPQKIIINELLSPFLAQAGVSI